MTLIHFKKFAHKKYVLRLKIMPNLVENCCQLLMTMLSITDDKNVMTYDVFTKIA